MGEDSLHPNPSGLGLAWCQRVRAGPWLREVGQLEGKGWDARVDPRAETLTQLWAKGRVSAPETLRCEPGNLMGVGVPSTLVPASPLPSWVVSPAELGGG